VSIIQESVLKDVPAALEEKGKNFYEDFDTAVAQALRKMEKVCVFIDNSNLFHTLRALSMNRRLDYIRLKNIIADGRQADVRFYYSEPEPKDEEARQRLEKQARFYSFLEKSAGYTMIRLPLWERTVYNDGDSEQMLMEKGLDCEIVFDLCKLSLTSKYDTFVLVAGDQDYTRTIKKIREQTGIKVEVAFFGRSRISSELIKEASKFIDLQRFEDQLFAP
jgi:uncharacterized LabA/DUF88 family protein